MAIGKGLQRDDRRRRVLRDERSVDEGTEAGRRRLGRRVRTRYGAAARRRHQPAIVDLLPLRWRSLGPTLAVLLSVVALLTTGLVLDAQQAESLQLAPRPDLRDGLFGTLARMATWCASASWLIAALIGSQIFLVRRHRRDDYRGHFALWRRLSFLAVLMSIDATAHVAGDLAAMATAGRLDPMRAAGIGLAVRWLLGTAVIVRLGFEIRENRGSLVLSLVLWSLWSASLIAPPLITVTPWTVAATAVSDLIAGSGAVAVGLLHARFVIIDAASGGRIRRRKPRRSVAAETSSDNGDFESEETVERASDEAVAPPKRRRSLFARRERPAVTAAESATPTASSEHPAPAAGAKGNAKPAPSSGAETTSRPAAAAKSSSAERTEPARKSEAARKDETTRKDEPARRDSAATDPVPASRIPTFGRSAPTPVPTPAPVDEHDDDDGDEEDAGDDGSTAGLSKAQRKKLAKQQRRQQRRAA